MRKLSDDIENMPRFGYTAVMAAVLKISMDWQK